MGVQVWPDLLQSFQGGLPDVGVGVDGGLARARAIEPPDSPRAPIWRAAWTRSLLVPLASVESGSLSDGVSFRGGTVGG